jgi:hypothetical protein
MIMLQRGEGLTEAHYKWLAKEEDAKAPYFGRIEATVAARERISKLLQMNITMKGGTFRNLLQQNIENSRAGQRPL